ncbi:MAG: hypothetical protein EOP52_12160 [Sphingobacteriales bacterium]|nr:MAG: hypothetical protein EOP52_12160 [Sphingobacteriales bacterium]
MRYLLITLLIVLSSAAAALAQRFGYVYIQGDKETPIYVKLEGEMQPRYGQHYSILPRLAPGVINVEILFQQNKFLPQKFALLVPEGSQRSFLLTQRSEGWALFDLQQKFYIPAGNIASQDRYNAPDRNTEPVPERPSSTAVASGTATPPTATSDDPAFIPDLELSRRTNGTGRTTPTPPPVIHPTLTPAAGSAPPVLTATGCSQPMTIEEFGTFYGQVLVQAGLEARLTFLMDSDQCPTPDQARIVARSLTGDAVRFRYLSRVVRRSAKPKTFLALTNVFEDAQQADNFRSLINSL